MESKAIKDPQIFISKEARQLFDNLREQLEEFKQMDNRDFFMLAVLFGYLNNKRKKLEHSSKTESGFTRERYLSLEDNGILKAIAIAGEKDISIVNKIVHVYSIAEEYANGGISYLKEFIFGDQASFIKNFAHEIKKLSK
ncbi:MAG TPA: hypothetical protein ACFYED_05585 [Candidatus Tripitaka californicus]|uniref:hypothetical protein n=1 Tax=Candidatus Tripitaka californicus TaxID=3367616 RepID=UPI004029242A|nr:hypothetical protein [Planctomycetota bacterium]